MHGALAVWRKWHFIFTFGLNWKQSSCCFISTANSILEERLLTGQHNTESNQWVSSKDTKQFFHTAMRPWQTLFSLWSIWGGIQTCASPRRHSSCGCSSRLVTPHLGYLTNWHSLIQSVKLSLSNTLSGGPDLARWLCEDGEERKGTRAQLNMFQIRWKPWKNQAWVSVRVSESKDLRGYLRACDLGSARGAACAGSARAAPVFIPPHTAMTLRSRQVRLTIELQHRGKREVKTGKISAMLALRKCVEIKCQHVIVVKCCLAVSGLPRRQPRCLFTLIMQFSH